MHGFLGLKDIHVYKRDVDNQFSDIFKSNPALMPEGADLNRLKNEAIWDQNALYFKIPEGKRLIGNSGY